MTYTYGDSTPDDLKAKREAARRKRLRAELNHREQVRARLKVTGRRSTTESPTLHPGDTPAICAERLIAASMEAGQLWEYQRHTSTRAHAA